MYAVHMPGSAKVTREGQVSELESIRIGKHNNWKVSESMYYTFYEWKRLRRKVEKIDIVGNDYYIFRKGKVYNWKRIWTDKVLDRVRIKNVRSGRCQNFRLGEESPFPPYFGDRKVPELIFSISETLSF